MDAYEDLSYTVDTPDSVKAERWGKSTRVHRAASQRLLVACEAGDLSTIRTIFDEGSILKSNMTSYMVHAIVKGWLAAARYMLELGADPNGMILTPMIDCRSLDGFNLLLEFGCDFKLQGYMILEYMIGRLEILEWLVAQGVDINSNVDQWDPTQASRPFDPDWTMKNDTCGCLNEAALHGDIKTFDRLVSLGATPSRSIALHKATYCVDSTKGIAMMTHLLEKYNFDVNMDVSCNGLNNQVGFHMDTGPPLNWALMENNFWAVEFLLQHGADPQIGDSLVLAVQVKERRGSDTGPSVKVMLEAGADPLRGLFVAIHANDLTAGQLCLEHGADPVAGIKYHEKQLVDIHDRYNGMSSEMEALFNDWFRERQL